MNKGSTTYNHGGMIIIPPSYNNKEAFSAITFIPFFQFELNQGLI